MAVVIAGTFEVHPEVAKSTVHIFERRSFPPSCCESEPNVIDVNKSTLEPLSILQIPRAIKGGHWGPFGSLV